MPVTTVTAPLQTPVLIPETGRLSTPWALWVAQFSEWRKDIEGLYALLSTHRHPPQVPAAGVRALKIDATVTTVANTVTETQLNSYTFPANTLLLGQKIRIKAQGVYSTANATDGVAIKYKIVGAIIHSLNTPAGTVTNAPWSLEWEMIVTAVGAAGSVESGVNNQLANNTVQSAGSANFGGVNTTVAQPWALSVIWSNALPGNTISIRQFAVESLKV